MPTSARADVGIRPYGANRLFTLGSLAGFLPLAAAGDRAGQRAFALSVGQMPDAVADRINAVRAAGGRCICVGTTSVRTLESAAGEDNIVRAGSGDTGIFITPGYRFRATDALITNFHLPQSTLLMLISALMGREEALRVYNIAVEEKYRFFSFGDAMLIL